MRFQHRDGEDAAGRAYGTARPRTYIDDDGTFEVDDPDEEQVASLVEAGHDPLDGSDGEDGDDAGDANGDEDDEDVPQASDHTEEELVAMDRQALRSIAAHYDDVDGNASGDKLTELLIERRREETDQEAD